MRIYSAFVNLKEGRKPSNEFDIPIIMSGKGLFQSTFFRYSVSRL